MTNRFENLDNLLKGRSKPDQPSGAAPNIFAEHEAASHQQLPVQVNQAQPPQRTIRTAAQPGIKIVRGQVIPNNKNSRVSDKLGDHRKALIAGSLSLALVGAGFYTGLLQSGLDKVKALTSTSGLSSEEQYYSLSKPDCIMDTAFTAEVTGTADLLVKRTIIDSADPTKAKAVTQARAKAYADKKYVAPKELTVTVAPDQDELTKGMTSEQKSAIQTLYAMSLPEQSPFSSTVKNADQTAEAQRYTTRLPQAGYIAPKMPFSICLIEGSMDGNVVEQISPKHLKIHLDKFQVVAKPADGAINDYETNPPAMPNYPSSVPVAERQSLFTQKEIDRTYKFLAPAGKFDTKKGVYLSGTKRNPVIQNAMKLNVLRNISEGDNATQFLKDVSNAMKQEILADILPQLDEVNKEQGLQLTEADIVIDFDKGVPTSPATLFGKSVTIPPGEIALINPHVEYKSASEKRTLS